MTIARTPSAFIPDMLRLTAHSPVARQPAADIPVEHIQPVHAL
ncbi:MAG TPA: hypothetical protein VF503_05500 [Sphingobium sp.]